MHDNGDDDNSNDEKGDNNSGLANNKKDDRIRIETKDRVEVRLTMVVSVILMALGKLVMVVVVSGSVESS